MSVTNRHIELDLLRTMAIVLMVSYHVLFDLAFVEGWNIEVMTGPLKLIGTIAALLFLLLVGISFIVSWQRNWNSGKSLMDLHKKYFARGCFILAWGLVISLVTALWVPDIYIRFGILHLIGVSTILLPFFAHFGKLNALLGIIIIGIGAFFETIRVQTVLLLPVGIPYPSFASLDYYPLFPWIGVIVLGMALGSHIYKSNTTQATTSPPWLRTITTPGRYSLAIYLIHQPIILTVLWLFPF